MTECQGCGAWNDASRTLCVLCGTPLAETDEWDAAAELPPLPPLPDGGLRAAMPAWLREPPGAAPTVLPSREAAAPPAGDAELPLGPRADPRTFLTDDDFPRWLRDLAARRALTDAHPSRTAAIPPVREPPETPLPRPVTPTSAGGQPSFATPEPDPIPVAAPPTLAGDPDSGAPQLAGVAAPVQHPATAEPPPPPTASPREERRGREPWEMLLLAALLLGVVAAALWALVANGVFRLGP